MKRKGWVVPILVFIISFSSLFFYQKSQGSVSLASTTELPPILWSKSSSTINKITYSLGNKSISVTHKDSSWYLTDSNKQADDLYIYNILSHFTEPVFNKVIEISPKELTNYGIDDLSPVLTLYDNEDHEYTLIKGDAIDSSLDYVYAPLSDTVYSVDTSTFANLKIAETEWLNKQLLNFNIEAITKICFDYKSIQATLMPTTSEDGTITFTSSNISDNLSAEFVHFLQISKIEQFISDNANAHILEVYGFNSPSLKCTVYLNTGDTMTLTIGTIKQSENICYAIVNSNNSIVTIPFFDFSQFNSMYVALHESNTTELG